MVSQVHVINVFIVIYNKMYSTFVEFLPVFFQA